jgi:hypothetical protein
MLRQDPSRSEPPDRNEPSHTRELPPNRAGGIDIQRELNRIEEILFDSFHIPLRSVRWWMRRHYSRS